MIIEGKSIVCFAPSPWDSMWRNRHQLMTRLAKTNKVLYIEPQIRGTRELSNCLFLFELHCFKKANVIY